MHPSDQAPPTAPSMWINLAALQDRFWPARPAHRRQTGRRNRKTPIDEQDTVRRAAARGPEGEVRFFLQRIAGALYVEREELPRCGVRTIQSLVFDDRHSFERWCGDDPTRFGQPLLHAQLRRDGEALWRLQR